VLLDIRESLKTLTLFDKGGLIALLVRTVRTDTMHAKLIVTLFIVLPAMTVGPAFSGESDFLAVKIPANPFSQFPHEPDTALSKGKLLVAGRGMKDPRFLEAVILLVDYSNQGAMGLVINRPSDARLSKAFPDMEGLKKRTDPLYIGGPVRSGQMFMLVRSSGKPEDSRHVFKDVYVSGSKKLLQRIIGKGESGKGFHVFAGYAGWSPLQLDREVALGGWHVMPADAESIFEKEPSQIWPELIRRSSLKWIGGENMLNPASSGLEPL
jgi:putative transcriptional regulator